jgi:WD40 repeat protein
MTYLLLLVDAEGVAITSHLAIRQLREFPGGEGLSVHFRPVRNDHLFESAKTAGRLAYRILSGEGIIRAQLWVEYEVLGNHVNVTGRSSDLLFALALITAKWKKATEHYPAIAATGTLDADSATLSVERTATVHGVKHTAAKVAAAVQSLVNEREAVIFYPAADAESVANWSAHAAIPPHVKLHPIGSLEEALAVLGINLEKVYLQNPFRGLEHFNYEHRAIFFGRDTEIRGMVAQLLRREAYGVPGVLVEGASGSGKSSFMRAGVLPALVNPIGQNIEIQESLTRRPVRDTVRHAIWRAGQIGRAADETQIVRSILERWRALPEFDGRLPDLCESLTALADERQRHWPATQRFVWLIDQFEELFSLALVDTTIDSLGSFLARLQTEGAWTLVCIRADAVPHLQKHPMLRHVFGFNEGHYYLETMRGTALDDVIVRPAEAAGLSFGLAPSGRRLDEVMREEVYATRENTLPLLQFTLQELYQQRSAMALRFETYRQLGGLIGSVATAAEAALQADLAEADNVLPRIFRSLVSVDDEGRPAKRSAFLDDIARGAAERRILGQLVTARLCVTDQHEGLAVVSFAHEALLRTWPRLRDWLQQEGALLQARDLLVAEARRWDQHGKRRDWLATGSDRLASIRAVIDADIPVPEVAREFAAQSTMRARRASRVRRLAVASIVALAFVAIVFSGVATRERDAALQAQQRSLTETAAARLKDGDVPGALRIILEVLSHQQANQSYTPDALSVFQEARAADTQVFAATGHTGWVTSVAFSPDGRRMVTASYDNTFRTWDVASGEQLLEIKGHTAEVVSVAFSPDGSRIVTASFDKTARVWDATNGQQLLVLNGLKERMRCAQFSTDGRRIVTGSLDGTARVWDAANGRQILVLRGDMGRVYAAAFSPDGKRIVTGSRDKTVRIWDATTGRQLRVFRGHTDIVVSVAFSPDGRHVVTASYDKTARIWDSMSGELFLVLRGHKDWVESAAFSPDGQSAVTSSADNTVRVWDTTSGEQLLMLSGHTDVVGSAVFSPDGRHVLTGSFDQTIRLWDVVSGQQLRVMGGNPDAVGSAVYSVDGGRIVTACGRTARTWDATSGQQLLVIDGHEETVQHAAFSPDGQRIVTASDDKTARVWDAVSGQQLVVLRGHSGLVSSAAFSPDGRRIVTASFDGTARIWDASRGLQLSLLAGHTDAVESAAFSPDGRRIVTASRDKTARIWEAESGHQVAVLSGHTDVVASAEFSPDGHRIVTASFDKTARIWDAEEGRQLSSLSGHTGIVATASFSTDGRRIVTASQDKTARLWDAASATQIMVLNGHADVVESAAFSPDGLRIVTASDDRTVRIWNARSLPLDLQLGWTEAAQFDPLSTTERVLLGLPHYPIRAQAGDPTALVHTAETEERAALSAENSQDRDAHLLQAFKYYASAAELAATQGQSDEVWRPWRYRRASLARLLARDGIIDKVAKEYESVRNQYSYQTVTQRLQSFVSWLD